MQDNREAVVEQYGIMVYRLAYSMMRSEIVTVDGTSSKIFRQQRDLCGGAVDTC